MNTLPGNDREWFASDVDACFVHKSDCLRFIKMMDFETDVGDVLIVNGVNYSGYNGPSGVIPTGEIIWSTATRMPWRAGSRAHVHEKYEDGRVQAAAVAWAMLGLLRMTCKALLCGDSLFASMHRWDPFLVVRMQFLTFLFGAAGTPRR